MRVLVLGGDGYLGWPTAMYFAAKRNDVMIVDNGAKRQWEQEVGGPPLWEIPTLQRRVRVWNALHKYKQIKMRFGDVTQYHFLCDKVFSVFKPDAVIHYAEQPSAPYSMGGVREATYTQFNNVIGTLNVIGAIQKYVPDAHLIKLGTMGEYGTPPIDIEEGYIDIEHKGRVYKNALYPKNPGSFYHLSKVHDSHNIKKACDWWGIRATDLNQGVVYGIDTDETVIDQDLRTSFHYDGVFGTVINRFCVQAVAGVPLTVYGKGLQTRGFLNIKDTLQCIELAVNNPAEPGEFRVFNQFTEVFSVNQLATMVSAAADRFGIYTPIDSIENPRIELEEHYYNAKNTSLLSLGLKPHLLTEDVLANMIEKIKKDKHLIDPEIIYPTIKWKMDK